MHFHTTFIISLKLPFSSQSMLEFLLEIPGEENGQLYYIECYKPWKVVCLSGL